VSKDPDKVRKCKVYSRGFILGFCVFLKVPTSEVVIRSFTSSNAKQF
jgi:hypothetical protein